MSSHKSPGPTTVHRDSSSARSRADGHFDPVEAGLGCSCVPLPLSHLARVDVRSFQEQTKHGLAHRTDLELAPIPRIPMRTLPITVAVAATERAREPTAGTRTSPQTLRALLRSPTVAKRVRTKNGLCTAVTLVLHPLALYCCSGAVSMAARFA